MLLALVLAACPVMNWIGPGGDAPSVTKTGTNMTMHHVSTSVCWNLWGAGAAMHALDNGSFSVNIYCRWLWFAGWSQSPHENATAKVCPHRHWLSDVRLGSGNQIQILCSRQDSASVCPIRMLQATTSHANGFRGVKVKAQCIPDLPDAFMMF